MLYVIIIYNDMYAIDCSSGDEEEADDDNEVSCRQNRNEILKNICINKTYYY